MELTALLLMKMEKASAITTTVAAAEAVGMEWAEDMEADILMWMETEIAITLDFTGREVTVVGTIKNKNED